MKQEVLKDKTQTLSIIPYVNNRPGIASAATVTITRPGGGVLVSGATATINSTTGEITYDFLSTANTELGENFQAQWTYTISSVTYYQTVLFDVVLNKLAISVVDDDLLNEQSDILDRNEGFFGPVDSTSNTTLVDADLKNYADDYFNGGRVTATDPTTGAQQNRVVSDFTQSTGTITVSIAWSTNPTSSYTYSVKRGFAKKVEAAFEEMMLDVRSRGYRPALILESSELKVPLIKKSLALICRDYIQGPEDKWSVMAQDYEKQYSDLFSKVVFQYDIDESGYISGTEKARDMGSVRMKR